MKIVILMGSPNPNGSTGILTDAFVRGAAEAGHACEIVDVCRADVHPCLGHISDPDEAGLAELPGSGDVETTRSTEDRGTEHGAENTGRADAGLQAEKTLRTRICTRIFTSAGKPPAGAAGRRRGALYRGRIKRRPPPGGLLFIL